MGESVEVRLARLEEMIAGLISRLDERCDVRGRAADQLALEIARVKLEIERVAARVDDVEAWKDQTKGGWMVLSAVAGASATIGGFIVALVRHP
jgi:hypothetical protein